MSEIKCLGKYRYPINNTWTYKAVRDSIIFHAFNIAKEKRSIETIFKIRIENEIIRGTLLSLSAYILSYDLCKSLLHGGAKVENVDTELLIHERFESKDNKKILELFIEVNILIKPTTIIKMIEYHPELFKKYLKIITIINRLLNLKVPKVISLYILNFIAYKETLAILKK